MYQPLTQVRLRGFPTEPAHLFVPRSGQPRSLLPLHLINAIKQDDGAVYLQLRRLVRA